MPPFSNSLPRRWSPSELPILPFLAPGLFQPWPPSKSARVHLKRKTNRDHDDDERSSSNVGEREFRDSSTDISVQSGTNYTRVSKRRTTPTSFTHGSIRHFSSRSDFEGIAEENGRDSPAPKDHSKVPYECGSNARMKAQPGTAASTLQDSGMEGSLHISSSPRRLQEQSNAPSMDSRGPHTEVEDAVKPGNIETSRLGDSFALSSCNYFKHTHHQSSSSSSTPPFTPQIESLKGLASPPPFSSTSTPAQKSSNASGSSCQPTEAAKKAIPTMADRESWENRSKIPDQSILRSSGTNRPSNAPGPFSRPKGLMFRPSEEFRRAKGPLLARGKVILDLHRLKAQGLATVQGPFQELCDQYELWAKRKGLPELKTKYLKIKINAVANIRKLQMWCSQFAAINQRHEDALKDYPKVEYKKVALSKFPMAIKLLFIKQDNAAVLANVWRRVPAETRSHVWQELMLTSMDQYPESTLKLLLATYQEPHPPPQWAANDCLDFVVSHYFGSEEGKPALDSFTASDLRHIFESIRYLQLRGLQISSRSMYLLQLMMTRNEFRTFYFVLAGTGQHLTGKTLLRFVYRFARSGETDLAFQVIQQATRQGISLNLERWPQICNVLLTRRYRDPNAQVNDTELFEFMLHHGLRPGICTYNILIQNSLQARDHTTAWQIYDMMIENGVMADGHTYSIMLNDAKVRRDDAAVSKLAHWMKEDGIRNDYSATDVLDSIFLFHRQEYFRHPPSERKSLPTSFLQMLPVYMKNFKVEPLAQLIPRFEENFLGPVLEKSADKEDGISVASTYQTPSRVEPDQSNPDLSISPIPGNGLSNNEPGFERHLMEPNPVTLIVMLKSYIGSVRNYKSLLDFYDHFKYLISIRNPIVAPLLKRAQIYNHLLVGLGHLDAPMHYCLEIIADMQTPHSEQRQSAPATETDPTHDGNDTVEEPLTSDETEIGLESDDISSNSTDDSFLPPPPNIQTWTTLLHVFMQRRQPRAAEKVLQIMIEKEGLEPNQATWNALTMGYMRLQDPLMVSDAIIRTKKSGFVVDHIMSSRWWLRFQARARLNEALQAASDGNETSLADVAIANAMESETEVVDPADDEIIDEEVLEATASKTGDIYRILKRRLHAVNSPVYPNWIFDAMLRTDEEDFIEQESESILDDVSRSRPESPRFPENPDRAIEQESGQLLNSQNTGGASPRPSETEDERGLRLLPANRLIVRRTG